MALDPILTFTTRFGLLAVELAVSADVSSAIGHTLAAAFFAVAVIFVYRSFYGARIGAAR